MWLRSPIVSNTNAILSGKNVVTVIENYMRHNGQGDFQVVSREANGFPYKSGHRRRCSLSEG